MGKRSSGNGGQRGGSFGKVASNLTSDGEDGLQAPALAIGVSKLAARAVQDICKVYDAT